MRITFHITRRQAGRLYHALPRTQPVMRAALSFSIIEYLGQYIPVTWDTSWFPELRALTAGSTDPDLANLAKKFAAAERLASDLPDDGKVRIIRVPVSPA